MEKEKKKLPFWLGILIGVAGAVAVMTFMITMIGVSVAKSGLSISGANGNTNGENSLYQKMDSIRLYLDRYYLWDIDESKMEESVLDGLMAGLGDKYAQYYTAEEFNSLLESTAGEYAGIGVSVILQDDGTIAVYRVFTDSPAQDAGIHVGDVIVEVEGIRDFESMDELVSVVKGEPGTSVSLVVARGGDEIPMTVTRANIEMDTVTYEMLDNNIGYIYIGEFDTITVKQFNNALDELEKMGMEKLILDLRNNPGGDYDSVVAISDRVLPEGIIMTVKDKEGNIVTENSTNEEYLDLPMAVLINENTASASEVFTGAIQDYNMATIIGTQSFGKGIVQGIYRLPDGSGMKFTNEQYYTPSGDSIHEIGITPDIVVELPEEVYEDGILERDEDTQLQKAVEVLSK